MIEMDGSGADILKDVPRDGEQGFNICIAQARFCYQFSGCSEMLC